MIALHWHPGADGAETAHHDGWCCSIHSAHALPGRRRPWTATVSRPGHPSQHTRGSQGGITAARLWCRHTLTRIIETTP